MNNIIKYSNKIFNIAGFSIEVIINDESMECYIPFVFDSFVVYKSEKIDYKLYLGKNSDTIYNYKKLTNSVFVENGNYLIENENRYHITYRIFDNWNSWNLISNSCEYTQNENNTNWIFVNKENNEINAVTGATISSKAVTTAVNQALDYAAQIIVKEDIAVEN